LASGADWSAADDGPASTKATTNAVQFLMAIPFAAKMDRPKRRADYRNRRRPGADGLSYTARTARRLGEEQCNLCVRRRIRPWRAVSHRVSRPPLIAAPLDGFGACKRKKPGVQPDPAPKSDRADTPGRRKVHPPFGADARGWRLLPRRPLAPGCRWRSAFLASVITGRADTALGLHAVYELWYNAPGLPAQDPRVRRAKTFPIPSAALGPPLELCIRHRRST
jgi:hypothetical protein